MACRAKKSRAGSIGAESWDAISARFCKPSAEHGEFRPRAEAETDPSWKQLIPYLVLRDGERIFLMRRTKAGGDERLHDRYTIGVGGHVNPEDGDVVGGLQA